MHFTGIECCGRLRRLKKAPLVIGLRCSLLGELDTLGNGAFGCAAVRHFTLSIRTIGPKDKFTIATSRNPCLINKRNT